MSVPVNVAIHPSQFPERVQAELRSSLHLRQINHKFHYDSYRQTQKWLELHQAFAPSRTDPNCAACYDSSFSAAARAIGTEPAHLIGLGCGGGQKDTRLLRLLKAKSPRVIYTPVDVSTAMVLVAQQAASEAVVESRPLVCDLSVADDLGPVLARQTPAGATRVITFFGMMPNFEPHLVLPKLANLVQPGDRLLLSANLAPGKDYAAGLRQILPLYENELTTAWLLIFLLDLGVEKSDGAIEWNIEPCPSGEDLLRVTAWFHFKRDRCLRVAGETFGFGAGEKIRLFFSYRYTAGRVHRHLAKHGFSVGEHWLADSEEEGVFLCGRRKR